MFGFDFKIISTFYELFTDMNVLEKLGYVVLDSI